MPYMLLVMEPRGQREARTRSDGEAVYQRMLEFSADLQRRGVLKAAESLAPDRTTTRVAVRSGQRTLTDGPFSEAKEMLGGFFLLDCASREEAVAIAAECPAAQWASIEIRETAPCYE